MGEKDSFNQVLQALHEEKQKLDRLITKIKIHCYLSQQQILEN